MEEEEPPLLPDDTWFEILTYFDVKTLIQKKIVCRNWKRICTDAIDAKHTLESNRILQTNKQLRIAVRKYMCNYNPNYNIEDHHYRNIRRNYHNPEYMEEIATMYGWPIGKWDVSNITNFNKVFVHQEKFNEDISEWDVSNATTMERMFSNACMFNQDLSTWDVSNVTSMDQTFARARKFNQELSTWNVSNVTNMAHMFANAQKFNQDLSTWDVSNVTAMNGMFFNARHFHQNLSTWDVSNVTRMNFMFSNATNFDQDISHWDISHITEGGMSKMFQDAKSFGNNISTWVSPSFTTLERMLQTSSGYGLSSINLEEAKRSA